MARWEIALTRTHPAHRQRGIAAIEFAIVFMFLFALLYCIATFGTVLVTRHTLTRAAEDGARVVSMFRSPTEAQIQTVVRNALGSPLKDTPGLLVSAPTSTDPVVVTVTYPYRDNALFSTAGFWLPTTITARAFVAKPPL